MRHRKQNYVVGFGGANQCAYGCDAQDLHKNQVASFVDLMTKGEAEIAAKQLSPALPTRRYVFKLVPVLCVDNL